jgi:hypothetical protein
MSNELVKRLHWHSECPATGKLRLSNPDGPEAADRIEAMQAALAQAEAERDAAYERAAEVAANFKHADPVDDKRDDGSGSFGLGVDVASDSIAAAIRQLKGQHHD